MEYVVELEKNVWIAPWDGDPGRTLLKDNAKLFASKRRAEKAITKSRVFRDFHDAKIIEVPK